MAELTVPKVDFSPLGELGEIYKKGQNEQGLKDALAGGIGNDQQSLVALAGRVGQYNPQLGLSLAQLAHSYGRDSVTDARNTKNDAFSQRIQNANLAINQARAGREASDFENTPDQYVPNPKSSQPGEPQYIDQYAQATAAASAGKPVQVDTIGGTKFMIRQPNGGYSLVDPNNLPSGLGAPNTPVPSSARVVGTDEGVARGLYPAPAAPPAAPQATSFADRFQGQPGQAFQPSQPADIQAVDPQTGRRESYLKTLDPQVQNYIKKIADYEIDPRTTSVKGGMRERVLSAVAQYDPTYDQNSFGSRAKAIKDFSTGAQGNSVRSFDVAIDHLNTLEGYVKAMNNGDSRLMNSLRNKWREATGSELPTNVQAVGPVVGAEVTKAIVGSNNALADREELRKPLGGSGSPQQIEGAIGAYKELMAGQLKGLKKQYEDTTGKKDFDKRVRQGTRDVLLGPKKEPVTIDGYTITEH